MKKGIILIVILCIVTCLILIGWQLTKKEETNNITNNTSEAYNTNNTTDQESNNTINEEPKTADTNKQPSEELKTAGTNNQSNEKLKPTEINKQFNEDLGLGLEVYHLTVNGNDVAVNLQTSGSSEQQENGPYYIWYELHVGYDEYNNKYKLVKEGIYHLEGYGIDMLKEFDMEEDAGVNCEFFEWDLTTSAYKGADKEYVAISFPAGTEDRNQATLLLATDEGDLVGEFTADVVHDITLEGTNVDKYKNYSGDVVFNSIKDGVITYLTPSDKMYTTDSNGKKVLDTSYEILELDEYSVTINNNKATAEKTGETYKITNASGKTFDFGQFRY